MKIYLVEGGEYEDRRVDSVWMTATAAEARRVDYNQRLGSWKVPGVRFPVRWQNNFPPGAECIADGATVIELEVDCVVQPPRETIGA